MLAELRESSISMQSQRCHSLLWNLPGPWPQVFVAMIGKCSLSSRQFPSPQRKRVLTCIYLQLWCVLPSCKHLSRITCHLQRFDSVTWPFTVFFIAFSASLHLNIRHNDDGLETRMFADVDFFFSLRLDDDDWHSQEHNVRHGLRFIAWICFFLSL